ncbi:hypothetical protein [Microbacterium lushaniae]|uniref:hypothetical protein n=1 Tax=Microbacterium lushaniae TaxID=2614639 RepID=UPI0017858541|nr:hypothetical protein [Microbacterium lushaniae]
MQGEHEDELRMLRARAYGPSADIHTDPAAVIRLEELEAAVRTSAGDIAGPPADAVARPETVPTPEPAPEHAIPEPEAPAGPEPAPPAAPEPAPPVAPEPAAPARGARPRWAAVLWPLSVVVALSAGATAASLAMPLVPRDAGAGATQVATLRPDPGFVWPDGLFGPPSDDAQGYADFLGVTAITAPLGVYRTGGDDSTCVLLIPTDHLADDPEDGLEWMQSGCGAGPFPAAVAFTVDPQTPASLRGRFPVGTAMQFVFDGERVGVFAEAAE